MTTPPKNNTIRILLVDDVAEAREGIKKLLSFERDFEVVGSASNGREGVAVALKEEPHIVIMDINMPDMDGLEAARQINKAKPYIGIIMMSVQDDQDYIQTAMVAGARGFIRKPPTMDHLYSSIRSVYDQIRPLIDIFKAPTGPRPFIEDPAQDAKTGDRAGHIIVVYSPQGGAGTTTVATNLASGLMKEGIKSLLVDADIEFGDVGAFLDIRTQSTVIDLMETGDELDMDIFDSVVFTHNSGMKVLMGPLRPAAADHLRHNNPELIANIVRQVAGHYDFVVVDTHTALDTVTRSLLDIASKVVIVVNPTLPAIKNTRMVLDLFDGSGYPAEKTMLILNKVIEDPRKARGLPQPEKIQQFLRRQIDSMIPAVEERIILNAINKGVPVIASDRDQSRAPIKQLISLSDSLYTSLMGVDKPEEKDESRVRNPLGGIFGR